MSPVTVLDAAPSSTDDQHMDATLAGGPFEYVMGLPAHVLVVHAVVVLLPLSALGAVVIALSATWRSRLRGVVAALATFALVSTFVAVRSGQEFMRSFALEQDPLVSDHAALGESARWWVLAFWLILIAYLVLERRLVPTADLDGASEGRADATMWLRVAAVALIVVSVVSTVQVLVTGHAGSRAVWERQVDAVESR